MNILADEGIDRPIVLALRAAGHTVGYIAETHAGIRDEEVLALARERKALLITADKDFGDLVFRQAASAEGVLLLRLAGIAMSQKTQLCVAAIQQHGSQLQGSFSVLTDRRLRIRHMSLEAPKDASNLFGLLHRADVAAKTINEMDDGIAKAVEARNQRSKDGGS